MRRGGGREGEATGEEEEEEEEEEEKEEKEGGAGDDADADADCDADAEKHCSEATYACMDSKSMHPHRTSARPTTPATASVWIGCSAKRSAAGRATAR